ncbi:MAG: hypothetical protein K2G75_05720, partial [Muribaculaceae bacterium]|nr:hypothetical protein [Muribaculaceae bacterium]
AESVKVQFLPGRSATVGDDAPEEQLSRYIDEMTGVGTRALEAYIRISEATLRTTMAEKFLMGYDQQIADPPFPVDMYQPDNGDYMAIPAVALPWVNEDNLSMQNEMTVGRPIDAPDIPASGYVAGPRTVKAGLSWMPYLLPLAEKIARAAGYNPAFADWKRSDKRHLIMMNAIPQGYVEDRGLDHCLAYKAFYDCRTALPHWTVEEFFEKIAPIVGGTFNFDHATRVVNFQPLTTMLESKVELTEVEDSFELTSAFGVDDEPERNYLADVKYKYRDPGLSAWAYMVCPWYLEDHKPVESAPLSSIMSGMSAVASDRFAHTRVYHADDAGLTFCFYKNSETNTIHPQLLDAYTPADYDPEGSYEELEVIPGAVVAGSAVLNPSDCDDMIADLVAGYQPGANSPGGSVGDVTELPVDDEAYQTQVIEDIENGEPETARHYDTLYVGYWPGLSADRSAPLAPITAGARYSFGYTELCPTLDLRLTNDAGRPYGGAPHVDESIKFTFYFHSRDIPDVNAMFYIRGHRYVCRRIETTMTARGLSSRMKGEFYPVIEDN